MKDAPVFSVDVIIPCWGRYAEFLPRAIASARDATAIIVVGDAGAIDVARKCGVKITVLASEPRSPGSARQQGLERATSEAVCFLDSDDELQPNGLSSLARIMARHPSSIAVVGRHHEPDLGYTWPKSNLHARFVASRLGSPLLLFQNAFPVNGPCLIRRASIVGKPIYPACINEDWHAAIALTCLGRVIYTTIAPVKYHNRPDSRSRNRTPADIKASTDQLLNSALRYAGRSSWRWRMTEKVAKRYRSRRAPIVF